MKTTSNMLKVGAVAGLLFGSLAGVSAAYADTYCQLPITPIPIPRYPDPIPGPTPAPVPVPIPRPEPDPMPAL